MRIHTSLSIINCYYLCLLLAITINFKHPTYSVDEDDGPAQPVLVLSNPSSRVITVKVTEISGSATGEYCIIFIYIMVSLTCYRRC